MALQLDVATRNARLAATYSAIGPNAILKLASGGVPASCAAADPGTVIASIGLGASWMADPIGGSMTMTGTWEDLSADASGTVGHYRIYASDGVTCKLQGTVTQTGAGGDMTIDNPAVVSGQKIEVTGYAWNEPSA